MSKMANEKRLIDLCNQANDELRLRSGCATWGDFADCLISNDVVPVVRCKDCKHIMHSAIYKEHFCTNIYGLRNICISNDDFCSHGERREGE